MNNNIKVVYEWSVDQEDIFYIGIGEYARAINMSEGARNDLWWEVVDTYRASELLEEIGPGLYKSGRIYLRILHENLSETESRVIEERLIREYGRIGLDEGGILTNRQIGFVSGTEKHDFYCTPINLYQVINNEDGTSTAVFVRSFRDPSCLDIPGLEPSLLCRCADLDQPSTLGYTARWADEFPEEDIDLGVIHKKGGNPTGPRAWRLLSNGELYRGQREIGARLDVLTGSDDYKWFRRSRSGLKGFLNDEDNSKEFYSLVEEVDADLYYAWKKNNKDEYRDRNKKYKEYKNQFEIWKNQKH